MSDSMIMHKPFSFQTFLKEAFRIYFRNFGEIAKNQILFFAFALLALGIFGGKLYHITTDLFTSLLIGGELATSDIVDNQMMSMRQTGSILTAFIFVISIISQLFFIWWLHKKSWQNSETIPPSGKELVLAKLLPLFLTILVYSSQLLLLTAVTALMLFIPVLAYMVLMSFVFQIALFEKGSYMIVLRRCIQMIKGRFWLMLGYQVVMGALVLTAKFVLILPAVIIILLTVLNGDDLAAADPYKEVQTLAWSYIVSLVINYAVVIFAGIPLSTIGKSLLYNSIRKSEEDWDGSVLMPERPEER